MRMSTFWTTPSDSGPLPPSKLRLIAFAPPDLISADHYRYKVDAMTRLVSERCRDFCLEHLDFIRAPCQGDAPVQYFRLQKGLFCTSASQHLASVEIRSDNTHLCH